MFFQVALKVTCKAYIQLKRPFFGGKQVFISKKRLSTSLKSKHVKNDFKRFSKASWNWIGKSWTEWKTCFKFFFWTSKLSGKRLNFNFTKSQIRIALFTSISVYQNHFWHNFDADNYLPIEDFIFDVINISLRHTAFFQKLQLRDQISVVNGKGLVGYHLSRFVWKREGLSFKV